MKASMPAQQVTKVLDQRKMKPRLLFLAVTSTRVIFAHGLSVYNRADTDRLSMSLGSDTRAVLVPSRDPLFYD